MLITATIRGEAWSGVRYFRCTGLRGGLDACGAKIGRVKDVGASLAACLIDGMARVPTDWRDAWRTRCHRVSGASYLGMFESVKSFVATANSVGGVIRIGVTETERSGIDVALLTQLNGAKVGDQIDRYIEPSRAEVSHATLSTSKETESSSI
jgi:hypothetical protein